MTDIQDPSNIESNEAQVMLDLESLIKSHITDIDKCKKDLRTQKEMLSSVLLNDSTYKEHENIAKAAIKTKNATKKELMKQPANQQVSAKIMELSAELKEKTDALSDYLREYQRMSGATEIETDDGEVREIVNYPKLIKKSNR